MKKKDRLQNFLYCIMGILGIYIIYKSGSMLLNQPAARKILDTGTVQKALEDASIRTYFPGYAAVVEDRRGSSWTAAWMKPLVPVYSYMAEMEEKEKRSAEMEDRPKTDASIEPEDNVKTEDNGKTEERTHMQEAQSEPTIPASGTLVSESLRSQLQDFDYLLNHYYTVDSGTSADAELLDADALLNEDLRLPQNSAVPQILIYHTHSQEAFADSEEGNVSHTIVGMGEVLAEELRKYGYQVIHDTETYDLVDGVLDRSAAYDYARASVEEILAANPEIEVIIDLHRDGVEGKKFVTEIDGKPASMIMFFNGISRNEQEEPLYWLENPYIQQNLAFSLQLQLKAEEQYPGFTRNIYLKAERFNLHLRPRSLLIEAGTQLNTVEEERNAMKPLARLIWQVLTGA